LGFSILKLQALLMGNSILATKIFSVALFLIMLTFTVWKLNLHLLIPKIEFEIPEKKPERKAIKIPLTKIATKDRNSNNILTSNLETDKKELNKNIIKNILKDKIKKKISDQQTLQNTPAKISYPKDKPTFSIENLEKQDTNIKIDEKQLIKKMEELQAKLAEFNIPVEIAGYEI